MPLTLSCVFYKHTTDRFQMNIYFKNVAKECISLKYSQSLKRNKKMLLLCFTETFCDVTETSRVQSRDQALHRSLRAFSVLPGHQQHLSLQFYILAVRLDHADLLLAHLQVVCQRLPLRPKLGCDLVHLTVGHGLALNAGTWKRTADF